MKPRQRQPSSSEPELVPVVKKIDETPGYENVIRDSQRGTAIKTRGPERKPEAPARPVNGIETDPTLVSNLLKESLAKPAPITVATERKSPEVKREPPAEPAPVPVLPPAPVVEPPPPVEEVSEHRHKKEKKKKDKHKHKDRDKSKEERKKHKKDKEKRKDSPVPQPVEVPQQQDGALRITIPKEKLSTSPGLKIKIPKERLAAPPPPPQTSSLKIKISRDVLDASRKRAPPPDHGPPPKVARHNGTPHHPKVGNWNVPPPFRQPLPYFMVQPPPPLYYGLGMDGYYYGMEGFMYPRPCVPAPRPPMPRAPVPRAPPRGPQPQPPLPAMPPPPVPPPPPE